MKQGFLGGAVMAALFAIGCGEAGMGGGGGGGGQSLNQEACARLKSGPFVAVAGQVAFNDKAPKIRNDDKAYRVSLQTTPTLKEGHVGFAVPASGMYVLFTNKKVPVAVFTFDGTMIPPTSSVAAVSECGEVKGRDAFDLTMVETYVLRLGPDASGSVDVVIEANR